MAMGGLVADISKNKLDWFLNLEGTDDHQLASVE
jgi:hypothetical protein